MFNFIIGFSVAIFLVLNLGQEKITWLQQKQDIIDCLFFSQHCPIATTQPEIPVQDISSMDFLPSESELSALQTETEAESVPDQENKQINAQQIPLSVSDLVTENLKRINAARKKLQQL